MLAKEIDKPFDDSKWLFEIKWDGYRAIAEKTNQEISLYSRNGLSFQEKYPIVVEQLKTIKADAVLDGEIIILDENGKPNFQYLQHYSDYQDKPIQYQVFDLLELNGVDTKDLELAKRKELLQQLIPENEVIKYCDHILEDGISFFELTTKNGLEGMMAKKIDSIYLPGKRTGSWVKIKNHQTQEVIIAGYTAPEKSRKYFGALILAEKKGKDLVYVGHTGTGFSDKSLKEMYELMQPLIQKESPFIERVKTNSPATWIKPELVCEIKFTEITKDGKFRHPVFLRLRDDKEISEVNGENLYSFEGEKKTVKKEKKENVIMEKEKSNSYKKNVKLLASNPKKEKKNFNKNDTVNDKITTNKSSLKSSTKQDKDGPDKTYTFGKTKVTVSNVDKIYFPEDKITKGDVVNYYISMAEYILPYLKGRPESLLRNPNGIHASGFFHKDAAEKAPSFVMSQKVHSESNDKEIDYIVCNNLATLVYMNNLGCIEINPWHSTIKNLENPDYLMIDIDPSDKNTFDQVVEVAIVVKKIFDKAGAVSYCKTSGASGLHVYVPTAKKYTFEQVKDFAYLVCMMVNEDLKDFTTLERNLRKRGNKHIYLDYLQNRRGQTIASVYSLRPKPGATVSTPLEWKEVKKGLSPQQFTIHNIAARVKKKGDLFKGVLGKGINLLKCIEQLEG
jgi:bifunctional non-homologous end joining protein LigD